jgi:hypothetical protein
MIRAELKGLELTMGNLQKLQKATGQSMKTMLKGVMIQAAKSAVILTPPSRKKPRDLAQKWVRRPEVGLTAKVTEGRKFWVNRRNQIFSTTENIPKKKRDANGIEPVKRAIKYWDKKTNKWSFAPINPKTGKSHLRTGRRIPGAGAVKAGWIVGLKKMGTTIGATPFTRSSALGTGILTGARALLKNNVRYGSKIAGHVPRQAEQKAWNWLKANLWRTEKKKLQRMKL